MQKKALELLEKRIESQLAQTTELKNEIKTIQIAQTKCGHQRTKCDIERINAEIAQLAHEKAKLEKKLIQRKTFSFLITT